MKPVLFHLGPFPVSSFGVFLLVAFVTGILLLRARTARLGWDSGEVLDLSLYAIIGGVIGARLGYVLVNASDFRVDPTRVVTIWKDAGLTFYGALLGGAVVAWLYGRRRGWGLAQAADAAAPGLASGYAIAMIGTLLYGLNYGRPTTAPWAVPLFGEPRHPTQLYLMAASLVIFAVLLGAEKRPHAPGSLFWQFLFLYAVARDIIEVWMDSPRVLGPLTIAQGANTIVALIAGLVWLSMTRRLAAAGLSLAGGQTGPPPTGGTPSTTAPRPSEPSAPSEIDPRD